jgi:hypothetical protein
MMRDRHIFTGQATRVDALHAMQFRGVKAAQVNARSFVDRGCPPATARARSIWHAGGTADKNGR